MIIGKDIYSYKITVCFLRNYQDILILSLKNLCNRATRSSYSKSYS
jgi:hypothetical protein